MENNKLEMICEKFLDISKRSPPLQYQEFEEYCCSSCDGRNYDCIGFKGAENGK